MRKPATCLLAAGALIVAGGAALAQTSTPAKPNTPTTAGKPSPTTTAKPASMTLTEQQAKSWVGKPVYSSDNKKLGEIAEFKRGTDNVVQEMRADIGGFLGMGETRVKLTPQQFRLQNDRAILNLTQAQAKTLPHAKS
jgi:hypothetical protein